MRLGGVSQLSISIGVDSFRDGQDLSDTTPARNACAALMGHQALPLQNPTVRETARTTEGCGRLAGPKPGPTKLPRSLEGFSSNFEGSEQVKERFKRYCCSVVSTEAASAQLLQRHRQFPSSEEYCLRRDVCLLCNSNPVTLRVKDAIEYERPGQCTEV